MLPSLGRRARRFVRHDLREALMFFAAEDVNFTAIVVVDAAAWGEVHVRSNPMANLAAFGIIARRSVGVREGDC